MNLVETEVKRMKKMMKIESQRGNSNKPPIDTVTYTHVKGT